MKIAVIRTFEEISKDVEFPPSEEHEKKKYTAALNKGENERSGGSLFASASNVYGNDDLLAASADPMAAAASSYGKVFALGETYNPSTIIYRLRQFGVAFNSVEEMLESDGFTWSLTREDMKAVNILLQVGGIPPIQWKWLVQGETVFPWVPVDRCEVPKEITPQH